MAYKIGFLGCGQMATAMAKGFVSAKLYEPSEILLSDVYVPALESMSQLGYETTPHNRNVAEACDVIIIAVKPNVVRETLLEINPYLTNSKLLISICAGILLSDLRRDVAKNHRIVRVMPNVCCLIGEAASCFCSSECNTDDIELVTKLLKSVGRCYPVDESKLDAVTGLSGSGPAYVYLLIDAMSDAGVKGGLPRNVARGLAAQTVLGAAKMVLETGQHPCVLKDQVTSPGGTTIVGVAELERTGFRHSIISAIDASRLKSIEMSKEK